MIDQHLIRNFSLYDLLKIGAMNGKNIAFQCSRKKRNILTINYGDTLKELLVHHRYDMDKTLLKLIASLFVTETLNANYVKNIQWILTKKRYNELSAFVVQFIMNDAVYQFYHDLCKGTPSMVKNNEELEHKTREFVGTNFRKSETSTNSPFELCDGSLISCNDTDLKKKICEALSDVTGNDYNYFGDISDCELESYFNFHSFELTEFCSILEKLVERQLDYSQFYTTMTVFDVFETLQKIRKGNEA